MKNPCVYIMTNKTNGVLYIGMTTNIQRRMEEYRHSTVSSFVKKYKTYRLVHLEFYPTIPEAATREKQMKKWKRDWKIQLIEQNNKNWRDLVPDLVNHL